MKKSTLFGLTALVLPLLLLLAVDRVLMVVGVSADQRVAFREIPGREDYLALSPTFAKRYFQGFEPSVPFTPFLKVKPENTFRVFALGGSSTAGFPFQFGYAFPARLSSRLEAFAPGQRIEVVNLGMTAVNSYAMWDLAWSVAGESPDAVVIYAGHNEYYGAFGVGSNVYALGNRHWLKRLTLRLKRSPLFLLLERTIRGRRDRGLAPETERTMMARVVRDATIAFGGDVFARGVAQFRDNMDDLVRYFDRAGVPVYVATLTSNLADQSPLGDRKDALAFFQTGDSLHSLGQTSEAREAYLAAKDADDIRFRAPEMMNDVVRGLARHENVTLVDVQAAFREQAHPDIEGNTLFVDHLHPNVLGYDLMSIAFFEALRGHASLHTAVVDVDTSLTTPSELIDPFEKAHSEIQIQRLLGGYPFDKTSEPETEATRFRQMLLEKRRSGQFGDSLAALAVSREMIVPEALLNTARLARADEDTVAALLAYRSLLHWQPFNVVLNQEAIALGLSSSTNMDLAAELAQFGATRTGEVDFLNALGAIRLRQRRLHAADAILTLAEASNPNSRIMLYNTARLRVLQGDTLAAREYFRRYTLTGSDG